MDNRKKNKKRFNIPVILTLCFFLSLIFVSIFGSTGIVKVFQLNQRMDALKNEIQLLEKENNRISKETHQFKTDPYYIEKIAREELGLVKPKEKVYEFVDEKEDDGQSKRRHKNSLTTIK